MSIYPRRARATFASVCSGVAFTLLASGCGKTDSDAAVADLRAKLGEAQRKDAESRRRVDDLENRVFLLTDQLESHKVELSARSPRLPVVTLHPSGDDEAPADAVEAAPDNIQGDIPIEMTGAARSPDPRRIRPSLHGEGPSDGQIVASSRTHAPAAPSADVPRARSHAREEAPIKLTGGDSLGVAPAPPIPKGGNAQLSAKAAAVEAPIDQAPLTAYRAAYAELTAGHYDEAELQMRAFLKRFPRHDYADNAQYWLGESLYARHRYREAAVEFRATVAKYPVGNKAPDALLKLAYSLVALGESGEAKRVLGELPSTYPRSEAARLATLKLGELGASPTPKVEDPR
jgi:tol-pal system protein YbgF